MLSETMFTDRILRFFDLASLSPGLRNRLEWSRIYIFYLAFQAVDLDMRQCWDTGHEGLPAKPVYPVTPDG
jgi:hypothetical protein